VGYTNNIDGRILEHNRVKGKYTDKGIPWLIVYTEKFNCKKDAMNRENFIKKQKSRKYIFDLNNNQ